MNNPIIGRGWSFPISFDLGTKQVNMVEGEADIEQSLHILFNTTPGERTTFLSFGSELRTLLFDPIQNQLDGLIKEKIKWAVIDFEPRIIFHQVLVDRSLALEGKVSIRFEYIIRDTNERNNIVFPFYKIEGTSVQSL